MVPPSAKIRPVARGGNYSAGRGAVHGRAPNHARGRGKVKRTAGDKSTFYSTRVEETEGHDANQSGGSPLLTEEVYISSDATNLSSDEDLESELPGANSYNTLLQSLNAGAANPPTQRKKRKIGIGDSRERPRLENHQEHPEKRDDFENTSNNGGNDHSDPDESNAAEDLEEEIEEEFQDVASEDAFSTHFADPDEPRLAKQIANVKNSKLQTAKLIVASGLSCSLTGPENPETENNQPRVPPQSTEDLKLKQKLQKSSTNILPVLSSDHRDLASPMFKYEDILYVERTTRNCNIIRNLSCLHLLNHLFKTRDRVIKNNSRLAKDNHETDLDIRDQGFTRPKVLVILPTRQSCAKWMETIISLCEPEQQENRKRFQESYTRREDNISEEKPADFRELFDGNDDDMFRVGLKFTRKTIRYFSQFYNSDIIFASPLGLRMAVGADNDKQHDHDFLSSIEITILDQADALSMQNWEHVEFMFDHLNLQPKEAHGCDFSRVRNWYLDGNARYLRQTMIFSAFNFPALNRLYLHQMLNVAGKMKMTKLHEGAMLELSNPIKQTFSRFDCVHPISEPDDRFTYFSTTIVPILIRLSRNARDKQGILLYLPSYADFVRVRNHLATSTATQNLSFGSISEYTSVRDVARARSHFFTGRHSVLLYTERAHHFRRFHLRGVKSVFMYGLPENPTFYREIVGEFLGSSIKEGKLNVGEASLRALAGPFTPMSDRTAKATQDIIKFFDRSPLTKVPSDSSLRAPGARSSDVSVALSEDFSMHDLSDIREVQGLSLNRTNSQARLSRPASLDGAFAYTETPSATDSMVDVCLSTAGTYITVPEHASHPKPRMPLSFELPATTAATQKRFDYNLDDQTKAQAQNLVHLERSNTDTITCNDHEILAQGTGKITILNEGTETSQSDRFLDGVASSIRRLVSSQIQDEYPKRPNSSATNKFKSPANGNVELSRPLYIPLEERSDIVAMRPVPFTFDPLYRPLCSSKRSLANCTGSEDSDDLDSRLKVQNRTSEILEGEPGLVASSADHNQKQRRVVDWVGTIPDSPCSNSSSRNYDDLGIFHGRKARGNETVSVYQHNSNGEEPSLLGNSARYGNTDFKEFWKKAEAKSISPGPFSPEQGHFSPPSSAEVSPLPDGTASSQQKMKSPLLTMTIPPHLKNTSESSLTPALKCNLLHELSASPTTIDPLETSSFAKSGAVSTRPLPTHPIPQASASGSSISSEPPLLELALGPANSLETSVSLDHLRPAPIPKVPTHEDHLHPALRANPFFNPADHVDNRVAPVHGPTPRKTAEPRPRKHIRFATDELPTLSHDYTESPMRGEFARAAKEMSTKTILKKKLKGARKGMKRLVGRRGGSSAAELNCCAK